MEERERGLLPKQGGVQYGLGGSNLEYRSVFAWPGAPTSQVRVISAGQITVSVFQLCILVPVAQLTIHARIAALIALVLFHSALALVLIRSTLDYVADDLSEFFMCHLGFPCIRKNTWPATRRKATGSRPRLRPYACTTKLRAIPIAVWSEAITFCSEPARVSITKPIAIFSNQGFRSRLSGIATP